MLHLGGVSVVGARVGTAFITVDFIYQCGHAAATRAAGARERSRCVGAVVAVWQEAVGADARVEALVNVSLAEASRVAGRAHAVVRTNLCVLAASIHAWMAHTFIDVIVASTSGWSAGDSDTRTDTFITIAILGINTQH